MTIHKRNVLKDDGMGDGKEEPEKRRENRTVIGLLEKVNQGAIASSSMSIYLVQHIYFLRLRPYLLYSGKCVHSHVSSLHTHPIP